MARRERDSEVELLWFLGVEAFHAFAANTRGEVDNESLCGTVQLDICATCGDEPVRSRAEFRAPGAVVCEMCYRLFKEG
jgi:hypothetical protein